MCLLSLHYRVTIILLLVVPFLGPVAPFRPKTNINSLDLVKLNYSAWTFPSKYFASKLLLVIEWKRITTPFIYENALELCLFVMKGVFLIYFDHKYPIN